MTPGKRERRRVAKRRQHIREQCVDIHGERDLKQLVGPERGAG
jgi:hypothetical protein